MTGTALNVAQKRPSSILTVAILLGLAAIMASCDDQPPPTSPIAEPSAEATSVPPPTPVEQWRFEAPDRCYARAAASDQVVVAAAAPVFPQFHPEERFVVALERDSGAERWRVPVPCAPLYPAVDDERAYLPCNDGRIRAWNLSDGSEAWSVDTQAAPVFIIPAGGFLFVADGDPEDGYDITGVNQARIPDGRVRAIEAATGTLRWELTLQRETAYLALSGDVLYVATADRQAQGEALAVTPATSAVLWRTPVGPASSRPFVTADSVYVAEQTGGLHRLSARDGLEKWRASVPGGGVFHAPVVAGGVVVAGTNVNAIYALNAADGSISARGRYCDCPFEAVALGNQVLVTGLGIALLDPAGLRILWAYPGLVSAAMPVVADGWFFVPAGNVVVTFRYR